MTFLPNDRKIKLFSTGLALWTIYGIALRSIPIIAANTVTLGLSLYLIYLKVKYG